MQEVKKWFLSFSNWLLILTIVGVVIDKLIAGGVLPNEGWAVIVSTVIGIIIKRGMVEGAVAKSNALVAAAGAANPPQPPQG